MKKNCNIVIITLIIFCTALYLLAPVNHVYGAAADDFIDVSDNYWGYPFIDFAAKAGIIQGYPTLNNSYIFKPESPVTKEESMQMIYQAIKNSGIREDISEDEKSNYEQLLADNKIGDWAYDCVSFGLAYGILEEQELASFRTDSGTSVYANREQVGRWAAKAIDRDLMPATSLDYLDKDQISKENLPYIDLLNRMDIMVGDNLGKFNPTSNIKRVEFATICTRIYELSDSTYDINRENRSFQGTVTGVNSTTGRIFMSMDNGAARVIDLADNVDIVIDGTIAYNGIGKIKTGVKSIIAWGPFDQVHVTTEVLLGEGRIQEITPVSRDVNIIELHLSNGNPVYYFMDGETLILDEPQKGDQILFIADGVKLIEVASQ